MSGYFELNCVSPIYIAEKIKDNRFKIAGGVPGMEVSWLVTGIRHDAWAEQHRVVVEEDKPAGERGFYLNPALYSRPEIQRIGWVEDEAVSVEHEAMQQHLDEERREIDEERRRIQAESERFKAERASRSPRPDNQP